MWIGFEGKEFRSMFGQLSDAPSMWEKRWNPQAPIIEGLEGLTLLGRIYTLWNALTIQEQELDTQVTWIDPAPSGQAVDVSIVHSENAFELNSWLGCHSLDTKLISSFELDGGGTVWVVHRYCPTLVRKLEPISK